MNISNLVTLRFPIPSAANSSHIFLGIISLKRFWISTEKGWKIVTINIELKKRIDGKNHIKLLDPITIGIEPIRHAHVLLELVKIAASPIAIKNIKEKHFLKYGFDFSRTNAMQNGQIRPNQAPA